ncbi:MAG: DUF2273 domain-containing protein [Dictyoglomus sp.]|nr:DUF2273 domain-containing protein [Dictyoglomus sp.]MCX7941791.1 DUF2273 domain-containing protein [Dictyoglomaceae bacterium]MDW8188107.1 DUF2273 domain-containing protein [Dictyoglomus sp.]
MMNWKKYRGRIIGTIIGIILAISFLTIGFWKTLFWVSLTVLGFIFGSLFDNKESFYEFWDRLKEIFINLGREK